VEFVRACLEGQLAEAESMLEGNPQIIERDLVCAGMAGEVEVFDRILGKEPGLAWAKLGPLSWEPLLYLAFSHLHRRGGRSERVATCAQKLISVGANPNAADIRDKRSALYGACGVTFNLPLTDVLLEAGANANDSEALYHACETHDLRFVQRLYDKGADPKTLSFYIKHKVDYRDLAGVRWFLERGADPNADEADTLVHRLILRGLGVEALELAVEHGANLASLYRGEITPYTLAARRGDAAVAELLASRGLENPLHDVDRFFLACGKGDEFAIALLLEATPNLVENLPVDTDETGFTLAGTGVLSHLAMLGNRSALELALNAGMNLEATGWMGGTPLHFAAMAGHADCVELLLQRGALPHAATEGGETALDWMGKGLGGWNTDENYAIVLEQLIGAGLRPEWNFSTGREAVDAVLRKHGVLIGPL